MNTAGIIVEFNPLHNGHIEHINKSREITGCDNIIAVMSGNFVQRGEPAIYDKWQRTKMALQNGVDIVLELPVPYVIAGADYFARAGVGILHASGVVDALCFGSESGNLHEIKTAGEILANEPKLYKEVLRTELDAGMSFAAARGAGLAACIGEVSDGLLTMPNNCLGIEYCKALKLLQSDMQVFTTHRLAGGPSATKIRQSLADNKKVARLDDFSNIFKYLLYTKPDAVAEMGEGLGNRFMKFCEGTISEILDKVKTKRYTYTRLQRAVLGLILGISATDMQLYEESGSVQYIRILGFRKNAENIVGEITKKASLPVVTCGATMDRLVDGKYGYAGAKMILQELTAGDIYRIATGECGGYNSERGVGIIVV